MATNEETVEEINIRSTTIRTLNNVALIVPNSEFISTTVTNWSHGDPCIRLEIDVGVSYDSDLDTVITCLLAAAREHPRVLKDPPPKILHMGFGDSAWNMRLWAWVPTPEGRREVQSDLHCAIVRVFRQQGVEIPFPQQDIHVRTPISLPLLTTRGPSPHSTTLHA